jgi:hypothetical protein
MVSNSETLYLAVRTADGEEIALSSVTVAPGDLQTVNITDTLAKAEPNLMGESNEYGSSVIRYRFDEEFIRLGHGARCRTPNHCEARGHLVAPNHWPISRSILLDAAQVSSRRQIHNKPRRSFASNIPELALNGCVRDFNYPEIVPREAF